MKQIVIDIFDDGEVKIETRGFAGKACVLCDRSHKTHYVALTVMWHKLDSSASSLLSLRMYAT